MLPLHVSEMLLLVLPVFSPGRNHFYQKAQPTCTILYSEEQYSSPNLRTQGTVGESLALVWASVSCFQFWLLPQKENIGIWLCLEQVHVPRASHYGF